MAINQKRAIFLTSLIMLASIIIFSVRTPATQSSHSITTSGQIIIDNNDINYTATLPSVPQELMNISEQVRPRVAVEYSSKFFRNGLDLSSQLLNITETVSPRLRAEYSTEILSKRLSYLPSDLAQLTFETKPRIMVEYSSLLFTTSLILPSQLVNDTIPPLISEPIQVPPDFVDAYQNVTITVNVTDVETGVWRVILSYDVNNGVAWNPLNMTEISNTAYQVMIPGHENGTFVKYKITAFDNMGNQATRDNNGLCYTYQVGTLKPPGISVISPQNTTYVLNSVFLTFSVDEPTSWMGYSIDSQANATVTGNTTLMDLIDGTHYLVVYGNGTTGSMGLSNVVEFTVDTTPPNITNVSQMPPRSSVTPTPADEVQINATVTDATSGVNRVVLNYTTDNITVESINMTNLEGDIYSASIRPLPSGTNVTYLITAEDNADNTITTQQLGFTCQYQVVPEFPSPMILAVLLVVTSLVVILAKRKSKKALLACIV